MLKFFKNIPLGLTYILPLALLTGPAISDIIIVTISLWFLISSFYTKDYYWIKLPVVKIFFLLWFSLILIIQHKLLYRWTITSKTCAGSSCHQCSDEKISTSQ